MQHCVLFYMDVKLTSMVSNPNCKLKKDVVYHLIPQTTPAKERNTVLKKPFTVVSSFAQEDGNCFSQSLSQKRKVLIYIKAPEPLAVSLDILEKISYPVVDNLSLHRRFSVTHPWTPLFKDFRFFLSNVRRLFINPHSQLWTQISLRNKEQNHTNWARDVTGPSSRTKQWIWFSFSEETLREKNFVYSCWQTAFGASLLSHSIVLVSSLPVVFYTW